MKINAYSEIQNLINNGLIFEYEFDRINKNKINIAINDDKFTILNNIILKLKKGEKLIFMLNNDSIFWKNKYHGVFVRIDSNMGSLQEWMKEVKT